MSGSVLPFAPLPIAQKAKPMTSDMNVRLAAMVAGTEELRQILTWQRPHDSEAEKLFAELYVDDLGKLPQVAWSDVDAFGNRWFGITYPASHTGPTVLWSCHIDTMAKDGGRQEVQFQVDGQTLELKKRKPGRCLGADDGAGLWLLREMIRAGIPGTYVFHRGEEVGRLGSRYVAKSEDWRLMGHDACVAFDRKGTDNLITHQMGERGISKAFAGTFAAAINQASGGKLAYVSDDTGSYTDSYSYFDTIPECTNVSVGYQREHGPNETLDALHLWDLRNALLRANLSDVVVERDPTEGPVYDSWDDYVPGSYQGYSGWKAWTGSRTIGAKSTFAGGGIEGGMSEADSLLELCREFPDVAASLLDAWGVTTDAFLVEMHGADAEAGRSLVMGVR